MALKKLHINFCTVFLVVYLEFYLPSNKNGNISQQFFLTEKKYIIFILSYLSKLKVLQR